MQNVKKILVAGVGGQGVVYLIKLMAEAALSGGIPVASSEIHGLAQRRGSVVAAITFGENSFGYIEQAGADFLIGLEPLETQRCMPFLHKSSRVIIDNNPIFPHSVNSQKAKYPDINYFVEYLKNNIAEIIFNQHYPAELKPISRNVYVLGRSTALAGFPLGAEYLEAAIRNTANAKILDESLRSFRLGQNHD